MTYLNLPRTFVRLLGVLVFLWLAGAACRPARAITYYVATNGNDTAAGTNWDTALKTISNAMVKASMDTIIISNGTYAISKMLVIPNTGLKTIIGQYGADQTIINGQGITNCFDGYRAVLDGLTISNCYTTGDGAALMLRVNSVGNIIRNCVFTDCTSGGAAGGVAVYDQTGGTTIVPAIISNCTFRNNQAGGWGGGLVLALSYSVVTNCRFIGNRAVGALGGGGIYAASYSHSNRIANCVFSNNWAANRGGALREDSTSPNWIITNCVVVSNAAYLGGGLYVNIANIMNCTIISNKAVSGGYGGGIYTVSAGCTTSNSLIIANTVLGYGGGIYNNGTLVGSLIASNVANNLGGGVYNAGVVRSCTVASNASVTNIGGGIYQAAGGVENSIVYFNTAAVAGSNWSYVAGYFTNTCTVPSVAAYGSGNITNDPLFKDKDAGNYRLQSRSPCINAGLNQGWMNGAGDLDGNARILQMIVDMGAYEGLRGGAIISVR